MVAYELTVSKVVGRFLTPRYGGEKRLFSTF